MALPNKEELLNRASGKPKPTMNPMEYPLGYAADLIREFPHILPESVYAEVSTKMNNPFSETYAPVVLDWWAERFEGENLYEFAAVLADTYLELQGIERFKEIPPMFSRSDWINWFDSVFS